MEGHASFKDVTERMHKRHKIKSAELGTLKDPLANLRDFGWEGVLVRLGDKFHKLRSLSKDPNADPKKIKQTFLDLATYGVLGLIMYEEENNILPPLTTSRIIEDEEDEGKEPWEH